MNGATYSNNISTNGNMTHDNNRVALSKEEIAIAARAVDINANELKATAPVRLYRSCTEFNYNWKYTGYYGVAGVLVEPRLNHAVFLVMVDLKGQKLVFSQECYRQFNYQVLSDNCHAFEGDDAIYGFVFAENFDSRSFAKTVKSLIALTEQSYVQAQTVTHLASVPQQQQITTSKTPTQYSPQGPSSQQQQPHQATSDETSYVKNNISILGGKIKHLFEKGKGMMHHQHKERPAISTPSNFTHVGHVGMSESKETSSYGTIPEPMKGYIYQTQQQQQQQQVQYSQQQYVRLNQQSQSHPQSQVYMPVENGAAAQNINVPVEQKQATMIPSAQPVPSARTYGQEYKERAYTADSQIRQQLPISNILPNQQGLRRETVEMNQEMSAQRMQTQQQSQQQLKDVMTSQDREKVSKKLPELPPVVQEQNLNITGNLGTKKQSITAKPASPQRGKKIPPPLPPKKNIPREATQESPMPKSVAVETGGEMRVKLMEDIRKGKELRKVSLEQGGENGTHSSNGYGSEMNEGHEIEENGFVSKLKMALEARRKDLEQEEESETDEEFL